MADTGRPTKLTPALMDEIAAKLQKGLPITVVTEAVGIDDKTFYNWKRRGKAGEPLYDVFFQTVTRARGEGTEALHDTALAGDDKGVSFGPARAALEVLQRTRREYQSRVTVKVGQELELMLDAVERICSAKDCGCYEGILEAVAAVTSGAEASAVEGGEGEAVH